MKSMNSGTPASVALPERSSLGMMGSTRRRTVSHARAAEFVDDGAARRNAVAPLRAGHGREHLAAHLRDEGAERLLHVPHLLVFVVRPLPVEAQHGDAPPVHHARVELAVGVVIRDHLAASREADGGAVITAVVVLELLAVAAARGIAVDPAHEAVAGCVGPAPHL